MSLSPGSKLGSYEILGPLGAGGMGEVYRAADTKLEREVAIKVLPAAVAHDPERLARFEREAKVLASLNHPNIAHIYGLEQSESTRALAMELVPGTTLSCPQPIETALNHALQIAEALETAHEKGITHRDLKPANIMITPDGIVKLLDFGLAAVPGKDGGASDPVNSPTMTMAATQAGVILGTAAYMSPEQASGKPVDRRSDIWSFGVVLYEMLTGGHLFAGETVSHTLADVLRAEIPFDRLPSSTPAPIRDLVERCLDRDVRMRLQSIGEARIAIQKYLKNPSARVSPTPAEAASGARRWLWPAISVVLALLLAGALMYIRRPAEESGPVRLSFTAPSDASFNDVRMDEFVISPDGRTVAFTARDRDGRTLLWVRALESAEAKPLPGTDDPLWPFWSPDSRSLAFGSRGKLKRVDLARGTTLELCEAPRLTGGAWNSEGTILFAPDYTGALYRIPSKGGSPVVASVLDREGGNHWNPRFLPDGKHFLFHEGQTSDKVGVLGTMQARSILNGLIDAQFVPPNRLLFVSGGSLRVQRFDPDRQELEGEPSTVFAVPADLRHGAGQGHMFTVSNNGVLIWRGVWSRDYQLVWRDRTGKQIGVEGPVVKQTNDGQEPRLSPDGRQFAFKRDNAIWVSDTLRYVPVRLANGQVPIWTPDGRRVTFMGGGALSVMAANGVSDSQKLVDGLNIPTDWSPDGRFLLFFRRSEKTRSDIWILPMDGDRKPYPLIHTAGDDFLARFSPDGRWIAYASDESGTQEVYVRSFTSDGHTGPDRERISSNGGSQPIWRKDGKELFYLSPKGEILAVPVNRSSMRLEFGSPTALFKTEAPTPGRYLGTYDVTSDGQRFLLGEFAGEPGNASPTVILNWPGLIRR
jgi:Tol biopolymer transport system component